MRRCVGPCVLLLVAFVALAQDWARYKYEEGNFSILFPTKPEQVIDRTDGGTRTRMVGVRGNYGYFVVYQTYPSRETTEQTFIAYRDGILRGMGKCGRPREVAHSSHVPNYHAAAYTVECTVADVKLAFTVMVYEGSHRGFVVGISRDADAAAPPDVGKFLSSFALLNEND